MTQPETAPRVRLDAAGVCELADRYDDVAARVAAARAHLDGLAFGGALAGRSHTGRGEALRHSVAGLDAALRRWSQSASDTSSALRRWVAQYSAADQAVARRLGAPE